MSLFDDPKPRFVCIQAEHFLIDGQTYRKLLCLIQKAQPIRKFFERGKLVCYSMDGKIGNTRKTYCVFCDDAYRCQRKIRLSMIFLGEPDNPPVVLDINQGSFAALEELMRTIGAEQLKTTPVSLQIVYDEDDRRIIEFTPD